MNEEAQVNPHGGKERPLRVLFVESQTELGGAQMALLTMLEALDRGCVEPVFASLEFGNGDFPERVAALGIRVCRLAPRGRLRDIAATLKKIAALRRVIRDEGIDVVLSNSGHPLLYARPAAKLARRPCVWWAHAFFPWDPLKGDLLTLAQMFLASDVIFANSEWTARQLHGFFPSEPPIRLVRYGIDVQRHCPAAERGLTIRKKLGIAENDRVAGIFGRLQRGKGQHIFLEAAARVARAEAACKFLVVGGSVFGLEPEYAEELQRLVEKAGIADRVLFLGQRGDVNDLMNACDVVVMASLQPETWGLVVAEAMAAGRAVIANAEGGPLEMIEPGRTGMLVPTGDGVALAKAMHELMSDAEKRKVMGEAARRKAEEHFEKRHAASVLCAELKRVHNAYQART